jgi:hypothetical protein
MDDQGTNREGGRDVSRATEHSRMQAICGTLLGGFFGAFGLLEMYRWGFSLGSLYLLVGGCYLIVYSILRYRRTLEPSSWNLPAVLLFAVLVFAICFGSRDKPGGWLGAIGRLAVWLTIFAVIRFIFRYVEKHARAEH